MNAWFKICLSRVVDNIRSGRLKTMTVPIFTTKRISIDVLESPWSLLLSRKGKRHEGDVLKPLDTKIIIKLLSKLKLPGEFPKIPGDSLTYCVKLFGHYCHRLLHVINTCYF